MSNPREIVTLPLPRRWPKRVRSAVLHAISLARVSLTYARGWAANNRNARIRLKAENDRLRQEVLLLREELRIKDSRMARIPAQRRPHYPPVERMAILELRAARGWSAAMTADRLLVTPATVASWMKRLDEEGPAALVQLREPVNKFPDYVAYLVRRLKVLCLTMGKAHLARMLCRAGLHLGTTTVARKLKATPPPADGLCPVAGRRVTADYPNHVWHVDLTAVPIGTGFWLSWLPWSVPQRWPFCWWVAVVVDHFSRRVMGLAVYETPPTSVAVRAFIEKAMRHTRSTPKHLITDHGVQFTAKTFRRWCRRRGIRQRFGAVDKYGSLAVIERFIRTLKDDCTRRILVPLDRRTMKRELSIFTSWYNGHRPHTALAAATPDEVHFGRAPRSRSKRFEPRRKWPRRSRCAEPQAPVRGRRGVRLDLVVRFHDKRRHLPIVELKRAA